MAEVMFIEVINTQGTVGWHVHTGVIKSKSPWLEYDGLSGACRPDYSLSELSQTNVALIITN